jgi:hypothetical protein
MDEGDCSVCSAKGEASCDEPKDEEMSKVRDASHTKSECEWRGNTSEDDVEGVTYILEGEKKTCNNPIPPDEGHVDKTVDTERYEPMEGQSTIARIKLAGWARAPINSEGGVDRSKNCESKEPWIKFLRFV